jgi:hypothetical protein
MILGRLIIFIPIGLTFIGLLIKIKSPTMKDLIIEQYGMTLEEIKAAETIKILESTDNPSD